MASRRADLLIDNHESSSPDPLSLSGPLPISSPVRTPHRQSRTPSKLSQTMLAYQRSVSPQKTVILDAPTFDSATSPYRLRVTVQAEPKDGYSHFQSPPKMNGYAGGFTGAAQAQTFTIPLNDADIEQQTPRKRGRPRKSASSSTTQKRQPTPARPRTSTNGSSRKRTATPEPEPTSTQTTPKRKRGRPRKTEAVPPTESPHKVSSRISEIEAALEDDDGFVNIDEDEPAYDMEDSHIPSRQSRPSYPEIPTSSVNPTRSQKSPSRRNTRTSPRKSPSSSGRQMHSYNEEVSGAEDNDNESYYPTIPTIGPSSFTQTSIPTASPSKQSPRKSPRNSPRPTSTPLVKKWTRLQPSQVEEEVTHGHSRSPYSKSPQVQDEADAEAEEAGFVVDGQSVAGESNVDIMDIDMDDDFGEPIGDETMAKSMDMTMVSLSAIDNWNPEPQLPTEPTRSRSQSRSGSGKRKNSRGSSNPPSSPHVHFSSPLVTPTPPHIRTNPGEQIPSDLRQTSRSQFIGQDNAPVVSQMSAARPSPNPRHLPTPDSDDRDENYGFSNENTPKSVSSIGSKANVQDSQERKWAREREENIRKAQTASASQTIKIEDGEEEDDEEEVVKEMEHNFDQLESEGDIWQAVISSPQRPLRNNSNITVRPPVARYRESRQKYVEVTSDSAEPGEAVDQIEFLENEGIGDAERDDQSVISALFRSQRFRRRMPEDKNVEGQANGRVGPQSDDSMMSGEDLSSLLRRKVKNVLGNVDFSMMGDDDVGDDEEEEEDETERNMLPEEIEEQNSITASEARSSPRTDERLTVAFSHSPKKSSPLKRRLDIEEVETEEEEDDDDDDLNRASKRQMIEPQMPSRTPKRPARASLLKITQERRARASFNPPLRRQSKPVTPQDDSGNSKGIFNRVMSYITPWQQPEELHLASTVSPPSSPPERISRPRAPVQAQPTWPPSRPAHPLLTHFRLLPSSHPWTDNHFRSLLSLYRHWLTHEQLYSPSLPANAQLLSENPTWLSYADMELSNWGYELRFTPSLVVLAAVFKELCVLGGGSEDYVKLYPEEGGLDLGTVGSRTGSEGQITEWHIVLRLFTTIVGDLVREDEGKGANVDRRPGLRWRWKGGWLWRRGWIGGLL